MESRRIKVITLLSLMLALPLSVMAQQRKSEFPLHLEMSLGMGTKHKQIQPYEAAVDINYSLTPRLSIHAIGEFDNIVPKNGITDDYNNSFSLGGGIGYVISPADKKDPSIFELRAAVTSVTSSGMTKHTTYRAGLYYYCPRRILNIQPLVGVGYMAKDFRADGMKTYHGAFLSIGVRF